MYWITTQQDGPNQNLQWKLHFFDKVRSCQLLSMNVLMYCLQNGVIRGTLLALRFIGKDRGGRGGTVINMGSNVSLRPYVSIPIYTATKHAIVGFTRAYGVSLLLISFVFLI